MCVFLISKWKSCLSNSGSNIILCSQIFVIITCWDMRGVLVVVGGLGGYIVTFYIHWNIRFRSIMATYLNLYFTTVIIIHHGNRPGTLVLSSLSRAWQCFSGNITPTLVFNIIDIYNEYKTYSPYSHFIQHELVFL